jgi:hypothetical protein
MIAEQSSQSLALSSPGIFILPVPFMLSKFCVLAPLREILRPKSKILIHRNFSFQRHSKLFKAVQSHSRIFRNIFLFLCATAPSGSKALPRPRHPKTQPDYSNLFTPIYSYSSLLPSGGRIFLSATKNIRLYLFANRCQPLPSYASLCQLSPPPIFFHGGDVQHDDRYTTGRGLPRRSKAKAGGRPHGARLQRRRGTATPILDTSRNTHHAFPKKLPLAHRRHF